MESTMIQGSLKDMFNYVTSKSLFGPEMKKLDVVLFPKEKVFKLCEKCDKSDVKITFPSIYKITSNSIEPNFDVCSCFYSLILDATYRMRLDQFTSFCELANKYAKFYNNNGTITDETKKAYVFIDKIIKKALTCPETSADEEYIECKMRTEEIEKSYMLKMPSELLILDENYKNCIFCENLKNSGSSSSSVLTIYDLSYENQNKIVTTTCKYHVFSVHTELIKIKVAIELATKLVKMYIKKQKKT